MAKRLPPLIVRNIDAIRSSVEIMTDQWGVAHISADNAIDVFFGQGYSAARTRLFQIDLWRRRGLGLLAEVFGPAYVELDAAARTFLFRGSFDDEVESYGPETAEVVEAFVAGINQRVREVLAEPDILPVEFRAAGFAPSLWEREDIVRIRLQGLHSNAEEEIARAVTLRDFGVDVEKLRRPIEPDTDVVVPVGLDLTVVDPSILDVYRLAHAPFAIPGTSAHVGGAPAGDGSNNWALAGARTRSGRPLLATDPHRLLSAPSLRNIVHLRCPDFDVIGMNEPYMPGVAGGHNDSVAFSFTIAPTDVEDVYVYDIDENGSHYLYRGEWVAFTELTETIPVAGEAACERTVLFTRHGPVLKVDPERGVAFALRALWLDHGMTPYMGCLAYLRSRTTEDFLSALRVWGAPALNHVVADRRGHIAWQVAGRSPLRVGWDGLLPVPGAGEYEWEGTRGVESLPGLRDPDQGWVRSANQCNLYEDPSWSGTPFSLEFYSDYRARRIEAVLDSSRDWTIASMALLQNDYVSGSAAEALAFFDTAFDDADAEFARRELCDWDLRMTSDSRAAAIFDHWLYRSIPTPIAVAAVERLVPDDQVADAAAIIADTTRETVGDPRTTLALLRECSEWGASPSFVDRHTLLETTLAATVRDLRRELGEPAGWRWGARQGVRLTHPLDGAEGLAPHLTDTGRSDKPGSSDTVGLAFGAAGLQTLGASARLLIDVGEWDESMFVCMPGVDGDIESPHAHDHFATWLRDDYHPLIYSAERLAEHAESVIRLEPMIGEPA